MQTNFLFSTTVQTGRRGPLNLLYNGYRSSFAGAKRPGRGVDHPTPPSAEVTNEQYLYSPSVPSMTC